MAKKKVKKVEAEVKEEAAKEEVLDKKALREKKKKEAEKKVGSLWAEFKKFITRGNVVDMSIGVVIGGAFGAIVTALTNIFLSICTWTVPGGLKGLITVLPAMSDSQAGIKIGGSYIQQFATANLNDIVNRLVQEQGLTEAQALSTITSKYTLHGSTYVFNGAAIIDWGTFINAIISFIIIALVLFIIIKIFAKLQKTRAEMHAKAMEEYYKKHPEERPAPAVPGIPEPTDHQLLKGILAELQAQNKSKNTKKK